MSHVHFFNRGELGSQDAQMTGCRMYVQYLYRDSMDVRRSQKGPKASQVNPVTKSVEK